MRALILIAGACLAVSALAGCDGADRFDQRGAPQAAVNQTPVFEADDRLDCVEGENCYVDIRLVSGRVQETIYVHIDGASSVRFDPRGATVQRKDFYHLRSNDEQLTEPSVTTKTFSMRVGDRICVSCTPIPDTFTVSMRDDD